MKTFEAKIETLLSERLSGKTIRESAAVANFNYDYAREILCTGRKRPDVKEEYERRLKEQSERLEEEAYCSKLALIQELEELRDRVRGEVAEDDDGNQVLTEFDAQAWLRTIIERGKLCGHYIHKHEHSGKNGGAIELNSENCRFDFLKMSPEALEELLNSQIGDDEEAESLEEASEEEA